MANPSRLDKIQITGNSNSGTATKVNVQEANGEVNTQTINTGFNKNIGLNAGDVVGANTLLNQYSTTPVDWTATAFNSGQVVFYGGKQWIAKMATVAGDVPSVSSKWEEITFEVLANKTVIVDATPTDGSNNAVSSNGVFDALATKAPISSVHNPVTLGTANGLSLSNQQLSLGLASSGVTGALSGTDWNTFNGKFNTPTGLTPNYLPKWNGSGFGYSQIFDNGDNVLIGTTIDNGVNKLQVAGTISATSFIKSSAPTTNLLLAGGGDIAQSIFQPAITGLTTNYLPKWNGSGFGNSLISDDGTTVNIGGSDKYTKVEGGIVITGSENISNNSTFSIKTANPVKTINFGYFNENIGVIQAITSFNNTPWNIALNPFGGRVLFNTITDNGVDQVQVAGTISASPATLPNQVPTWGQVQAIARPYKVYTAVLSQQNTNAPVAVVLENTLGGTVVWTRNTIGNYYGTLDGAFPVTNKVVLFQGGDMWGTLPLKIIRAVRLNTNTVQIFTQQATDGALVDSSLSSTSIEIRVYN